MIFQKLKQKSIQNGVERNLQNRDTTQLNAKVRTIGFLVDEMQFSDFESLYDIFKDLQLQPKDIKVFSFIESKKKLPTLRRNQVQTKDFDWKGNLHNQDAQEFLDNPFDVLVGFYSNRHPIIELMISASKAKFKVGFQGQDDRLYDLVLAVAPKNREVFKAELKKYLTVFGKI